MPISRAGNRRPLSRTAAFPGSLSQRRENGFDVSRRSAEHGFGVWRRSAEHGYTSYARFLSWVPACAGTDSRKRESGFTLIELMIVITIIGLASAAVVLAMPDPRGRLRDEAERFAGRARAAHDSAIVDAQPVSVWVSSGGYGFDRRKHGAWQPIGEKPFQVERWNKGTIATVATGAVRDRIMFDSTGLADHPFDVRLTRDGETATVLVGTDGSIRIDG
jgi:general secretion pathway protein H